MLSEENEIKIVVPHEVACYLQYGDEIELSEEDKKKAQSYEELGEIYFDYDEIDGVLTDFGYADKATTIRVYKK